VSLLLDALKRAEQEKLARGGGTEPSAPPPVAHAAPRAVAAVAAVPALELQPLGAAPGGGAARHDAAAHAAQVVFQAKAAANAAAAPERKMGMVWATIGAVAVVAIAAGAYVWYSINALTPQATAYPIRSGPPRAAPPAAVPEPPVAPAASVAVVTPTAANLEPAPGTSPVAAPAPPPAASAKPATPTAASSVEALLRDAPRAAPPPLKLDRTEDAPRRVPAGIAAGYEALRQGDIAAARRNYDSALAADPANVDARLGLATAEARAGNRPAAAHHYRRVLEADPRNAVAQAGLAALSDFARPDALESQLRAQVESQPGSAALRFTLGTLFASQGRWHDAQAEFFEAHRLEPGAADILFNLAVSLDHLGQSRVAADFYARALDAARSQPAQFDPAAASRRLAEIR
jgi:Tfp pilus assembly protein PilF